MTYAEKLKNPKWQAKRLRILERDQFTCTCCGDKETELQIHHTEYKKNCDPWDYEDSVLKTVCKHCHVVIETFKSANLEVCDIIKEKKTGFVIICVIALCKGKKANAIFQIENNSDELKEYNIISDDLIKKIYKLTK